MTLSQRIQRRFVGGALVAASVLASPIAGQDPPPFERGLVLYRENKLAEALPLFEAASDVSGVEARVYLAETLRRLDRLDEAVQQARTVLALVPCHAFAHAVLGAAYAPQYSGWEDAHPDSAWAHSLAAVECDPELGDAWLFMALEAMRRGERELERKALRRLYDTGFLTPSVLAYNRWVLTSLPDKAVLLTGGDWDTYPALALQVVEQLRSDVAVLNIPMLAQPWYLRTIRERHGVSIPGYDPDFPIWESRVIGSLRRLSVEGRLGRPLHAAVSVGPTSGIEGSSGTWQLAGPTWRLRRVVDALSVDTASLRAAIDALHAADLAGPATSPADRSPIRVSSGRSLPWVPPFVAVQYGHALLQSGKRADAARVAEWLTAFVRDADFPEAQSYADQFRQVVEGREPPDGPFKMDALDQVPERLDCPPVVYPDSLRHAGVAGSVSVTFVVGIDGAVEEGSIRVDSSTHRQFTDAAVGMVLQCRFRPGQLDGRNVRTLVTMPVNFR